MYADVVQHVLVIGYSAWVDEDETVTVSIPL